MRALQKRKSAELAAISIQRIARGRVARAAAVAAIAEASAAEEAEAAARTKVPVAGKEVTLRVVCFRLKVRQWRLMVVCTHFD